MKELIRKVLDDHGYDEWSVTPMGDLICPCGHTIEQDGECPEGHTSPLFELGVM